MYSNGTDRLHKNLLKLRANNPFVLFSDFDVQSLKKQTVQFQQFQKFRRKERNALKADYDEHGRPMQKIALLCGPPGLGNSLLKMSVAKNKSNFSICTGKTTLAHTIARHAGYNIVEINASDDRSPEAFKLALENGTQMKSFLAKDNRPNCIILGKSYGQARDYHIVKRLHLSDEIDGAPVQSIDFLIKFIGERAASNSNLKGKSKGKNLLRRPIVCICNDMYVPALRQLRQIAFVVNFPQMESGRLADR